MLNRVIHFRLWMLLVLIAVAAFGFAAVRHQTDRADVREAIRRLRSGNAKEREAASFDLTYYATDDGSGVAELVSALEDKDPEVIESVKIILRMVHSKFRTAEYLGRELRYGTPSGRFHALRLLCEDIRPSYECINLLVKTFREDCDPRIRASAMETLMKWRYRSEVVVEDFPRWDKPRKLAFVAILGRYSSITDRSINDPEELAYRSSLQTIFADSDPDIRAALVENIAYVPSLFDLLTVDRYLNDPSKKVRLAVWSRIHSYGAFPREVVQGLCDPDPEVRLTVVRNVLPFPGLGNTIPMERQREIQNMLLDLFALSLAHKDERVREAVADRLGFFVELAAANPALLRRYESRLIPIFILAALDPSPKVRKRGSDSLRKIIRIEMDAAFAKIGWKN